jgi:hypothetical protein
MLDSELGFARSDRTELGTALAISEAIELGIP